MQSLDAFAGEKLAALDAKSLLRRLRPTRRHEGAMVERDGKRLISFSCNDYLGLSQHPAVRAAAAEAALNYGAGAAASRLVTGDHPLLSDLEKRLARLKGTEAACVFGSGYLTNTGVIPTLVGPGDAIFVDALAHACIWAGAQLSGAKIVKFVHNDVDDLERLLGAERPLARRALVATDGVFSMDGDIAPLDVLSDLCASYDAWLLSDDAHGVGVLAEGRGSGALFPDADIPLQMGTLSKALGSYGGYLCGSQAVIDLLKTRARTLVYATGLPPASAAAALASLDIIEAEPALTVQPVAKARLFTRRLGLPDAVSPIVPVVLGSADDALAASAALEAQGFLVVAIRPPTVPEGTARLRIAFSAAHADTDVIRLADAIADLRRVAA
ncbi:MULTISPECIES: 8-amino-7-oxononanoate synthase [unclassified Caulobacter]|uniref:8-amino-7-oxononanoate synthase n=1 Tax=unclassified Caulobacter TaxID=2648921 RepID=UPI0006FCE5F7|nr:MULTISPECIES: 8-amino-7-oxononanoate synthase [unclassified Caulobacter]KQV57679.1 8-amino-7-oxononanoate synthase [Caulobacter sp. Root342]KQV67252.1 8-amino-7-oxononanoate synthase [Caulobacter sp. Root343]